jgi:hypothetical protein
VDDHTSEDEIYRLTESVEKLKHRNDALVLFTLLLSAVVAWNIPYSHYWSVPLFVGFMCLLRVLYRTLEK